MIDPSGFFRKNKMDKSSIDKMVDRFLGWKLPEDFMPDGGIKFEKIHQHQPTGTNLLTALQAREMIECMLDDQELK